MKIEAASADWTAGYVADVGYTYGYYSALNPTQLRLPMLSAGFGFPKIKTACELGFGQGVSVNLHAAASDIQWYGTDFNPNQAVFAKDMAAAAGSSARLFDQAFAEFAQRDDLPEFDFIGLHGIWSWISDDNRRTLVEIFRKRLAVGGVLYISYNTNPGWAAFAPMRHLMTEHAEVIGAEGRGIVNRINDAIDFASRLLQTNPRFAKVNPQVVERIDALKSQNKHYLAHEYFNRDWHPMHFSTMAEWLAPSKVEFACSAATLEHIDAINLTEEQRTFLAEIPDPMFRQSVKDFLVNQQFRKDIWVRGARRLSRHERDHRIRSESVLLLTPPDRIPLKIAGANGEVELRSEIYQPILAALGHATPRTVDELAGQMASHDIGFELLVESLLVLLGAGHLESVRPGDQRQEDILQKCDAVNAFITRRAISNGDLGYLASPVTGGGVSVSRLKQLMLLALASGESNAKGVAQSMWHHLSRQGERLVKDTGALTTPEENLAELERLAEEFLKDEFLTMQTLGILRGSPK